MIFLSPMDSSRPVAITLAVLAALVLGATALAGVELVPAAGGNAVRRPAGANGFQPSEAHGWAVFPDSSGTGYLLVHFPPRRVPIGPDGAWHGAPDGAVRAVSRLTTAPKRIAAVGSSAYLVFDPDVSSGVGVRRAMSITATPSGVSDLWVYHPRTRLEVRPSLPGEGYLVGFAGTERGPVAAIAPPMAAGGGPLELYWLEGREWRRVALPDYGADRGLEAGQSLALDRLGATHDRLVATGATFGLLAKNEEGRLVLYRAESLAPPQGEETAASAEWTRHDLGSFALDIPPEDKSRLRFMEVADGLWMLASIGLEGGVRLWRVHEGDLWLLGETTAAQAPIALLPDRGLARVVLAWQGGEPSPAGAFGATFPRGAAGFQVREFSAISGRALYTGDGRGGGIITARDFRLLVLGMIVLMAAVLFFVLRPAKDDGVVNLPENTALAEPGRRAIAGAIDAAIAFFVALQVRGETFAEIGGPGFIFTQNALWLVVTMVAVGVGFSMILTPLQGRTPGKWIAGCEVISARRGPAGEVYRPSLGRALIREVIKWVLPPVALLGLLDASHRHRADLIAGTVVIIRVPPAEPSE